ncbi:hypothetical protein CEXT_314241 [Caerostris extrusa]|uniref:Uncharacterized protein n=1 Tax=Caerostris extrusa TaxID=172846 RepID=A0AAV4XCV1_CAEEX|nr:hypothetical protein CEXT_314241 [Caerostris extrusa]
MEQLTEFVSKSFNPDRPLSSAVSGFPHLLASTKGVPGGRGPCTAWWIALSAPHPVPHGPGSLAQHGAEPGRGGSTAARPTTATHEWGHLFTVECPHRQRRQDER